MKWNTVIVFFCTAVTSVLSLGQPGGHGGNIGEYGTQNYPPKPYAFDYQVKDDHGNVHFRREKGDPSGVVSGSYGYMHINGLYRTVDYVADAGGFKAQVKTNEPGVGVGGPGPADVQLTAEPVPPGVQDAYVPSVPVGPSPAVVRKGYSGKKI
ncbi:uncharacterized protein NPIL_109392 [Nephila pilipes]|uniref:Cuticular protein n=1 Tax=Nephila pilipes TaxID=299642 RepID=A0A8X6TQM7_NEPPI|nr:uncharacterized protein NPIL_621222 [Nephila pilipes]GFT36400.1 uncharacterized protein NPIL_109392 [Nephila pilipes]